MAPIGNRRWVLAAAIGGSGMAFIDSTVVNVALPAIQQALHASAYQLQWVVESYALLLAALLLVGGALGDRFGRRRMFALGVGVFALASAGCGLAPGVNWLILARAVQGIGAALLVPGSLALISGSFPERERGHAIGIWSGFSGITAAIGPVLGGFLVDHLSWTWAFLINLPVAFAVLWIVWRHVPESRGAQDAGGALDLPGAALATLALGGVVYGLVQAPAQGWQHPAIWGALLVGLVAGAAFVIVESKVAAPMLPLALLRIRNFGGANLLTLLLYAALGGGLYFLPLNLIQVQGFSATAAGAALLPFIAIMFALSGWAGRLVDRFGPRLPLVVGPAIAAAGFALFLRPGVGGGYWSSFFPAVVVLGFGMTVTVAPLTTTVMNAVGSEHAGIASGINNAVSRAAGVLAIAVFGLVMAWAFDARLAVALREVGAAPATVSFVQEQRHQLAGAALPPGLDATAAQAARHAVATAFVAGFRWVMGLCALLSLLAAGCAWMLIGGTSAPARKRVRMADRPADTAADRS